VLFAAAVLVAAAPVLLAELELLPVAFWTVACTIWPAVLKTMLTRALSGEYEYVFCVRPDPTLEDVPV